jgi:hypothetical protein
MATIHNNLPQLRLAAKKTKERREDADDSELSHAVACVVFFFLCARGLYNVLVVGWLCERLSS